tara:strand:+ start:5227 stop:7674 length:2448 start_codon:yes stop_codon:yes gene_type:complete
MKKTLSFVCLSFILLSTFAQKSYKDKFQEASNLMEEKSYKTALPIWKNLLEENEDNSNLNYQVGICMINSANNQVKAESLPYFKKAVTNTSASYDPSSSKENSAPIFAFYFLGISQHLNFMFDEAIANFEEFGSKITNKNYLYEDNKRRIEMAKYAKNSVENPVNIEITNLGDQLNSEYPDYSPVVRIDESAIYYTSRRLLEDSSNIDRKEFVDGMYYEDIYVSYNDDDKWTKPERLNINTTGHEATINLSIDGRTLYIYKDDNGDGNLYYSNLKSDSAGIEIWSDPKKFGPMVNSKSYETHVAISPNGKKLWYVSDREGGYGGKDIYFCNLLPTGDWAEPQNAGATINTSGDEDGVFIHPDGVTMYFSSNGHTSIGGYDIFKAEYNEDSSAWTKPENLGYPINSVDDDVFFVTTPDGKRGYFSSFKEKGYGDKDIYVIQLFDAKETGLTLYTGEFTFVDRRTPPEGAQVIITDNTNGELVGIYTPRQRDGKFSSILQPNRSYHLIYEADDYESYVEDIFVSSDDIYQEIYKAIRLKPVRVGNTAEVVLGEKENINGLLTLSGTKKGGVSIDLLDRNKKLISTSKTDNAGVFNFEELDSDSTYYIRINTKNPEILAQSKIVIKNESGESMPFNKIEEGLFQFTPTIKTNGTLEYMTRADGKRVYKTKVFNIEAIDGVEYPESYPTEKELEGVIVYFQKFFPYNVKDIDENNKQFVSFTNDIAELIKQRGYADIIITSSASKVPTKTWKKNSIISSKRAYDTKALLERVMLKKGLKPSQFNFVDVNTLITGPEYKGDYLTNKRVYEKHQYVRVFIK